MGQVRKRGDSWYIDYRAYGKRYKETIGKSKKLAQGVLHKRMAEIAEGKFLDKKSIIRMAEMRNKLINGILSIENVSLNGAKNSDNWKQDKRLCNNINVSFNNIEGESLGGYLMQKNICTSTGSACMAHSLDPSHVLMAIGIGEVGANSSLRVTISKYTTDEEVDYFLEVLPNIVSKLRKLSPLA